MFKMLRFKEIFTPKSYPQDPRFQSASVDFSEDQYLSTPEADLAILNVTNWYNRPTLQALDIMNRHFDIVFYMTHSKTLFESLMVYAGQDPSRLDYDKYILPIDDIRDFTDCELWIILSDRLPSPILPIRPYLLVVYDYLQRYYDILSLDAQKTFIGVAQHAQAILVTTDFTEQNVVDYACLPRHRVHKVPMLVPDFSAGISDTFSETNTKHYFLWSTNLALHKNHVNACRALHAYYQHYQGRFACIITGIMTEYLLTSELPHLQKFQNIYARSPLLQKYVSIVGELPESEYKQTLSRAAFIWHPAHMDNGTFSVVEAAQYGVPALSNDYPPMREMDAQFQLNLTWMNATTWDDMARALKDMEEKVLDQDKAVLLPYTGLESQSVEALSLPYWQVIREYL